MALTHWRVVGSVVLGVLMAVTSPARAQELPLEAESGWRSYVAETERQIREEIEGGTGFLSQDIYRELDEARECRRLNAAGEVCTLERGASTGSACGM